MGVLSEQTSEFLERCRRSRKLVLIIVAIALLLDNMLLTTVGEYNAYYSYWIHAVIAEMQLCKSTVIFPRWAINHLTEEKLDDKSVSIGKAGETPLEISNLMSPPNHSASSSSLSLLLFFLD